MSKVKINYDEFESVAEGIRKAQSTIAEIENEWGRNFDNLCNDFGVDPYTGAVLETGFLNSLYKDAESQYYRLANLGYVVSYTAGGFGTGALVGSIAGTVVPGLGNIAVGTIGGIIGAVIGFFRGIYHCVKNPTSIKWCYDSRDVFAALLSRCACGDEDNYTAITNEMNKLACMQLAMTEIKTKINDFNQIYANLSEAAATEGVTLKTAESDGITALGIETSVNINGETISLTTSEALNAFYTYSNTVMSGEIAADYLAREYGYDINYTDIVKNANTFMTETIESGLYTHEFIAGVLPEYDATKEDAYKAIGAATNVDLDKIQSVLNNNASLAGSVALFGGLLGSAFVGALGTSSKTEDISNAISSGTSSGSTSSGSGSVSSGGGGGTAGAVAGGAAGAAGGVTVTVTPTETDDSDNGEDQDDPDTVNPDSSDTEEPITDPVGDDDDTDIDGDGDDQEDPDGDEEPNPDDTEEPITDDSEGPLNDIEIEPVAEAVEIPESVEIELSETGEVDYDELARIEFEFGSDYEEIIKRRLEITEEIEASFESGNLEDIRAELKEYGYSSVEIEAIIADKDITIKAILEGDQKAQIASKAYELAQEAGVENFVSSYKERPNYDDLLLEGPSNELLLATDDKVVLEAKTNMDNALTTYENTVNETNEILSSVTENENAMFEIKERYEQEFGTDTTMWTEEAVLEYNESIKAYNESVIKADEQLVKLSEVKNEYLESKTQFDNARTEYYDNKKQEYYDSLITVPDEPVTPEMGEDTTATDVEVTLQPDGTITIG